MQSIPHDDPLAGPGGAAELNDLQFATTVDSNLRQNVPIPPVPTGNETAPHGLSGPMQSTTAAPPPTGPPKQTLFSESSHPIACIFHCLFKIAALTLYIFGGFFASDSANFITVTVFCVLLLAADFWVVKNITGRLLVGLRWWNKVEADGSTTSWIYESAQVKNVNRFDNTIFWWVLYGTPLVWIALFVIGFLKLQFNWLITVCMAIGLSGANLYGYWKCSSDQKQKFQQMMVKGAEMGAVSALRSGLFGMLAGGGNGGGQQQAGGQGQATNYV